MDTIHTVNILENVKSSTGGPDLEIKRPLVIIPVEGYNWISENIAYYKSSSMSNQKNDRGSETKIRKYMWFPTPGLLEEGSFLFQLYKQYNDENGGDFMPVEGYIVKYIAPIFSLYKKFVSKLRYPPSSNQFFSNYLYYQNFSGYSPPSLIPPYLEFINFEEKQKAKGVTAGAKQKEGVKLINNFMEFINVMTQYCYNWKQIQDAVRLSWYETVRDETENDITLAESEFKDICAFILNYDIENQFNPNVLNIKCVKRASPLSPFNVVHDNETTIKHFSTESADKINTGYLAYNQAINEELLMKPKQETTYTIEQFKPYYDTMYLGQPFIVTPVGGKKKRKYKTKTKSANKLKKNKNKNKNKRYTRKK